MLPTNAPAVTLNLCSEPTTLLLQGCQKRGWGSGSGRGSVGKEPKQATREKFMGSGRVLLGP